MNDMHRTQIKKKESRRNSIIVLVILAALVIFAFVAWRQISIAQQGQTRMVNTPLTRTTVMSESGSQHHFEAQVTLEIGQHTRISQQQVNQQVANALSSMRHEDIIAAEGMENIRSHVQSHLENTLFDQGEIRSIYITNVLNDFASPPRDTPGRAYEFLREIFGR